MSDEQTKSDRIENVIIVGGGPAGYTAALYAARAELEPLVIEGFQWGGQLQNTTDVENYPGYPEGIMGPEMMNEFRSQAERFGARYITDDATELELSDGGLQTVRVGKDEHRARAVILSMGAEPKRLGLPGEMELSGRGVSTCGVCDGAFFKGEDVVVIGGGDSAMEDSIFVSKFARKLTIVHRRDEFRASKIMQERALANPKIEVIWNATVSEILGEGAVTGVRLHDTVTGEEREMPTDGVFMAIGHDPNTSLFTGQLDLDENGYVVVQEPRTHTSVPGVFAAGDVTDTIYKQAVTAAGQGCKAAIDAERFLEELAHAQG